MTDVPMSLVARHDVETCAGGGHNASGTVGWLGLAATPVFAILALRAALSRGQSGMLCTGMLGASPLNEMVLMYALMSIFHAAPWIKLVSSRRTDARHPWVGVRQHERLTVPNSRPRAPGLGSDLLAHLIHPPLENTLAGVA
jgi:hypothetical protein